MTGASGMVGQNLLSYLNQKGVDVIPTDLSGWEFSGNLLDSEFVFRKLGSIDFDAIIHLAAITEVKKTIEDPKLSFEVNCFATLNVLELARRKNVSRFLLSSSANVYGAPKKNPVTEDSPLDPRAPYDYSKVVSEYFALAFNRTKDLPVAITRSWLLFGEHDQPTRAIVRFIRSCIRDEPLTLFNGGRDTTAPSHATNFAKLALTILNNRKAVGEIFNFGGERAVSIRELAETIKRLTGSKSKLELAPPRSDLEREPQVSYPSTDKVRKMLDYVPDISLEQGLTRTIQWEKSQV